jgi:uncharacterized membrane protein YraQ (UPF0718 family)
MPSNLKAVMEIIARIIGETWHILEDSSVYVIFGLFIAGLLKVFVSPGIVSRHLGQGRFITVFKAALLGVPLPLCCCGVLPAAAALKREGANNGATTAFLISTPESGVDSMAVTYALMDPIMTVARPVAAFVTAAATGLVQNLVDDPARQPAPAEGTPNACTVDGCCSGVDCAPEAHAGHHTLGQKLRAGLAYAGGELWQDMAPWFLGGLLLTGVIGALVPEEFFGRYLGGGFSSMLVMLLVGIPLYICASASTPVAAALVLKGMSPGAALVFLLAGPATNLTALTVLWKLMGKKATLIYLGGIAICSVLAGLCVDLVYTGLGIEPRAVIGQAGELVPEWAKLGGALLLLALSVPPLYRRLRHGHGHSHDHGHDHGPAPAAPPGTSA